MTATEPTGAQQTFPDADEAPPEEAAGKGPPEQPGEEPPAEERGGRKLLLLLLGVLFTASIALLFLLFWLLRPRSAPAASEGAGGYPIRVETIIDGVSAEDHLKTPLGVAFDADGNVWVSDTGNGRVAEFTDDGDLIRVLGQERGPGKLFAPYGIAVDGDRGRVYVADWGGREVQVYATSGVYVGHLPADDQDLGVFGKNGFAPYAVQVREGRVIASSNAGLYAFDADGHVVDRWGAKERGEEIGSFNFPDAFVVDPGTGRTYAADSMNRRVVALDGDGRWLWVSGRPDQAGKISGFWQLPRGIALGPDGNLYVVDTFRFDQDGVGTGHIVVLSSDGELVSEFGRFGVRDDEFNFPEQIAVRPDGLFAIADRENDRVLLFRVEWLPEPDPKEVEAYRDALVRPGSA